MMVSLDAPVVQTSGGAVAGHHIDESFEYLNMPYAAPPVGVRRFRPPVRATAWEDVRDGTQLGPICPQPFDPLDGPIGGGPVVEDEAACLTVNAWRPTSGSGHPVFVWIHGGGFTNGYGGEPTYRGPAFARDGVLAFSFNYRLHAFGMLDLRGLFPGAEDTANLALRDCVAALEWIRDNAAAFGGDPANVTICGESAGAALVGALVGAPAARGLFQRAVLQSGSCMQLLEPEESRTIAVRFLETVRVRPGDWAALQAVPTEKIVEAAARFDLLSGDHAGRSVHLPWNTLRDERTMPRSGWEVVRDGERPELDLLIGTTADEYRLRWLAEEPNVEPEPLANLDAADQARLIEAYRSTGARGESLRDVHEAITNDQAFLTPAVRHGDAHVAAGGKAYMYLFTWRSPVLGGRIGAAHALENAFVFDQLVAPGFHGEDPPRELAADVHGAWVRFAKTGDPGGGRLPDWPLHDPVARPVLRFDVPCTLLHAPFAAELAAWAAVDDARLGVV
jgi:para-nitrobenzyl esterase